MAKVTIFVIKTRKKSIYLFFTDMKTFYLNGQKYSTIDNFSLLDLLSYFDYNLSLLVVEYNSFISTKKDWNQIMISDNDKIEVVTIVGGG